MVKELFVNDVYIPLIEDRNRFLLLYGGGGSGKSNFAAFKIVKRTLSEKGHKFLCLRKVGETVKESIFAEIQSAITDHECESEFVVNKTDKTFVHTPTGNMILCKGLDDTSKMKSIKGITGMWLEEATDFEENDLDQLNIRIRGEKPNYVQYILSFNPIDENHWIKSRFFDTRPSNSTVCHSTYKDNYFLSAEDKLQLESLKLRNELYYNVYCLGHWGIVVKDDKFMYAFNSEKHVIESYTPNPHLPILVSFDFNVSPMTCIVAQQLNMETTVIFDEMKIGKDGSTEELSEQVKAKYIKWLYNIDITGDATGRNREKALKGNISQYHVIKHVLELNDRNILTPSKNAELKDSRVLCNSVLHHAKIQITKNCKETINDVVYASVKINPMTKKLDVIKTLEVGRHFFDNFRYVIASCYKDFVKKPDTYRK